MQVLVTGGAGYIGSHVAKALAARGMVPVVYDNLSTGHAWAVKWGPLEEGDILDAARLREVMARHRIEAVIHFAAKTMVAESVANPGLYHRNNVEGTRTLLGAMVAQGVRFIVFSSSCAVYGIPSQVPIVESSTKQPISPYGETKWLGEQLLGEFGTRDAISSAALRYFNAAGADASGLIGEDHTPETHLIPLVLDAAIGRRPHITVLGRDYPTPDGSCIRDYIHVSDLAEAHVLALTRLRDGGASFAVNLGTGKGVSVLELIEAAKRITGREIPVADGARREGDPPMLYSDTHYCRELLNWQPGRSDIEHILRDAWHWHQRHFG